MPLFEFFCIRQAFTNNRRGLRLPLLLGRLHIGLIFSGASNSSGRKCSSEKFTLRSFLFIVAVLITKCGSSTFPNRTDHGRHHKNLSGDVSRHLDSDLQDFPLDLLLSHNIQAKSIEHGVNGPPSADADDKPHVKTLGYFLKGLVLPMLISITLSFGFIIYKNRAKRARLLAIQNALDGARMNPQHLPSHLQRRPSVGGLVSNALLSVLDSRGEWSLITPGSGGILMEGDDYIGEGGETARHKPYVHDKPPDYASVFDPPTYEQATAVVNKVSEKVGNKHTNLGGSALPPPFSEDDDHLLLLSSLGCSLSSEQMQCDEADDQNFEDDECRMLVNVTQESSSTSTGK